MRLLHEVFRGSATAWVWATITGANGRVVTPAPDMPWVGLAHLYLINRAIPDERMRLTRPDEMSYEAVNARERRVYWTPWPQRIPENQRLTPLCGRLPTRSTRPQTTYATARWGEPPLCPDCQLRAVQQGVTPKFFDQNGNADPWYQIPRHARGITADPVTGL